MRSFRDHKTYTLSWIVSLALVAACFTWIGFQVHAFSAFQMDLDEALHAARGLDMASALRRGSLPDLWRETVKPHWYPPGNGYLMGAWLLLAGGSVTSARLYAGFCYGLLGVLLWASTRQVFPRIQPFFLLAPALFLLSDHQHLILASMSMLDLPANLLAFASLYYFSTSLEKPAARYTLLASLFALMSFFTRYGQGVMILGTLAITYLMFVRRLKGRILKIALAWLPALVLLFVWLVVLGQWRWVVAYANVQPGEGAAWSLDSLLFYLRQLVSESSGWLPILVIAVWGFSRWRQPGFPRLIIPYLVFFATVLFVLSYRSNHIARFGTTLFPPLWVLAAGGAAELIARIRRQDFRIAAIAIWVMLLVFLALKNQRSLPAGLRIAYENTNSGVNDAYDFIAETVQASHQEQLKFVMYGETDSWNAYALHFYVQTLCMRSNPGCVIQVTGERELNKGWPPQNTTEEVREARARTALAAADYVLVFAKTPVLPQEWVEVARREFTFARFRLDPQRYQVVVLRPGSSAP